MCYSPPLLAGFRCLWWCAVPRHSWLGFRCRQWRVACGVSCVVCGERRWCVGGVVAGVWCGWSLATPGGGSRVLLPATPGWLSLPVVVGGPRHSWLRSPGGGGVWWGCGWCVVWLVPRHSWRRFPVCYSPPLLAGFRCRWWCAVPRHSWVGPAGGGGAWCVVCGVWCVVCGGGVLVGLWLWLVPRHSWRRFLCATPRHSWLGFTAGGGGRSSPLLAEGSGRGSPPLLAGVRWRRWCVVGLWLVCGVVGPSPLLAEVPVCYSPPLLAGFRFFCTERRLLWLARPGRKALARQAFLGRGGSPKSSSIAG